MAAAETTNNTSKNIPPLEERDRDIAAFSYTLLFAPVLLVTRRDSSFIQHHARQAFYLAVFCLLFALLPGKLSYLNILVAAAALIGFLEAQAGKLYVMPVISDLISRDITFARLWQYIREFFHEMVRMTKNAFTAIQKKSETSASANPSTANSSEVAALQKEVAALKKELSALKKEQ